jgi:uncharacterized membrane protein (UPF0127 family)
MPKKKKKKRQAVVNTTSKSSNKAFRIGIIIVLIIAGAFFILNNLINSGKKEVEYYKFKKEGELTITDSLGNSKIKIDLEIAETEYERQLGLMNRNTMEETQGMLFIFPVERMQSFWMRNTLIPLDILFINKNNEIVTIHKNTKVLSAQSYPSTDPAIYVLEVTGGFTDRQNIVNGDKIFWIETKVGN